MSAGDLGRQAPVSSRTIAAGVVVALLALSAGRVDPAEWFSAEEIAATRGAGNAAARRGYVSAGVGFGLLLVMTGSHVWARLAGAVGGWLAQVTVVGTAFAVMVAGVAAPMFVRDPKRAGQPVAQIAKAQALDAAGGVVLVDALLLGMWALRRHTALWWLEVAITVIALIVGGGLVSRRLQLNDKRTDAVSDPGFVERVTAAAARVGVRVIAVRQRRSDDAGKPAVTVVGTVKAARIVIGPGLVTGSVGEQQWRVARACSGLRLHFIGGWALSQLGRWLLAFAAANAVIRSGPVLAFAGAADSKDPAMAPLAIATAVLVATGLRVILHWVDRIDIRRADRLAVQATGNQEAAIAAVRADLLAQSANLDPPPWRTLLSRELAPAARLANLRSAAPASTGNERQMADV